MTGQPEVLSLDSSRPQEAVVGRAVDIIVSGGVIVAPTETRYGLVARADRSDTVQRVCTLKGRPLSRGMAVFLPSIEAASAYAIVTDAARQLARRFLPGPLTLVLKRRSEWTSPVAGETIGIRVSSAALIAELVGGVEAPLTATSANLSGSGELATIQEIMEVFGSRVDLYLDGGPLVGPSSTVVDCTSEMPLVVRRGAIDAAMIHTVRKGSHA